MKAVYFEEHGDSNTLQYGDRPDPEINDSEVLVRVKACALNHLDIWTRQGMPGVPIPLPHILGCDSAGIVEQVGSSVTHVKPGDSVVVAPGVSCRKCDYCQSGWDSMCSEYKILGFLLDGGYAELLKAPGENIIPISDKLSMTEWASIPLVFLTAWHMLKTRAELKSSETVLVQAAGSGVGIAAIQIAKHLGAEVITTAGSAEKLEKGKALGADHTINYKEEKFGERVQDITSGKGVDVVFEHIGPDVWEDSMSCLGKKGRLVTCGATSGPEVKIDLRFVFMKQLSILGNYMGGLSELQEVIPLVEQGVLKPVIDQCFPLKEAGAAHQHMENRKNIGKIILEV